MAHREIIVVGASSGGLEALKRFAAALPPDLPASVFIVWHLAPGALGILPEILDRAGPLPAAHGCDGEPVVPGRLYVAPPDHHLLLQPGRVAVRKGPKENRFRPAVDPLFRSAALAYGPRVIGVVLTGALSDGTAGLYAIKQHGGLAVVQDPADAAFPSMPESALRAVDVDHSVALSELPALLARLVREEVPAQREETMSQDRKLELEVRVAAEEKALDLSLLELGELTPFTCPACHGVLVRIKEGPTSRYRCHTGHAFSPSALLEEVTESIESTLWTAIRGMQESVMLLKHLGVHLAEEQQRELAERYLQKAAEVGQRVEMVRQAVLQHEQLSEERLRDEVRGA